MSEKDWNWGANNICFVGSICFRGFADIVDINTSIIKNKISIDFFPCIPAGLHPDAAIVITKRDEK